MARVKRGVAGHKRHKRLLQAAEGRRGTRSKLIRPAREALLHALAYATRDRQQRKRHSTKYACSGISVRHSEQNRKLAPPRFDFSR